MQQYAFMRTTLELPDELLKRAKIEAVERGITLKELVGIALARELVAEPAPRRRSQLTFPLFPSQAPGVLKLTGRDIAASEAEEDRRRHGIPG
jgi:hypothetical protein